MLQGLNQPWHKDKKVSCLELTFSKSKTMRFVQLNRWEHRVRFGKEEGYVQEIRLDSSPEIDQVLADSIFLFI